MVTLWDFHGFYGYVQWKSLELEQILNVKCLFRISQACGQNSGAQNAVSSPMNHGDDEPPSRKVAALFIEDDRAWAFDSQEL